MGENMWVKSICKKSFSVKSLWVKSIWVKICARRVSGWKVCAIRVSGWRVSGWKVYGWKVCARRASGWRVSGWEVLGNIGIDGMLAFVPPFSGIYIYYTIAFQFRSKSANFTLTLPAEAVPLVPIGGLKGPLVRFGQWSSFVVQHPRNKEDIRRFKKDIMSSFHNWSYSFSRIKSLSLCTRAMHQDKRDQSREPVAADQCWNASQSVCSMPEEGKVIERYREISRDRSERILFISFHITKMSFVALCCSCDRPSVSNPIVWPPRCNERQCFKRPASPRDCPFSDSQVAFRPLDNIAVHLAQLSSAAGIDDCWNKRWRECYSNISVYFGRGHASELPMKAG